MLKSTLRLLALTKPTTSFFRLPITTTLTKPLAYNFSKHKHDPSQPYDHTHHEHTENCSHSHKEQAQPQNEPHQHGPGCSHHHHSTPHPSADVKLSKLTFEQLIELNTQQSLRYAVVIYQQTEKKSKQQLQQKEALLKSIEFYSKAEQERLQKQRILTQHISTYEEEAQLSKRRAQRQIEDSKNYAVTKIAKELLEVADCVTSCRKFAESSEVRGDKFLEMVVDSHQIIKDMLKKFNIEQFDPTGQEYNPNLQESLLNIPTPPNFKPNYVAMTMRTGYTINGRLLRSARVGVFN